MPPRIARNSLKDESSRSVQQKSARKRKQRGLNAFAIASAESPDQTKISRHRLGQAEDDEPLSKKRKVNDQSDGEDDEEELGTDNPRSRHAHSSRSGHDELDVNSGSDGEGNHWRMGEVDSDDSDIDSEEAFGESDEERYEDFQFRGSSSTSAKRKRPPQRTTQASMLDETQPISEGGDDSDDSLGEDAVDLATMLDMEADSSGSDSSSDNEENTGAGNTRVEHGVDERQTRRSGKGSKAIEEWSGFDEDDDIESMDEEESESENDGTEAQRLSQLQRMIASMPTTGSGEDDEEETGRANAAQLLESLRQMSDIDPAFTQSIKNLTKNLDPTTRSKDRGIVKAPLPKRQQDRIDRTAAYTKAKDTLNRWLDTVKHNRRADHLSFPMRDPDEQEPEGKTGLLHMTKSKPITELENAIQTIMEESGLLSKSQKRAEEEEMREEEALQAKMLPMEEILARRAALRQQRELLFREEKKAKRIKKIKSKAYRRVHRREKERETQQERDLLASSGLIDSDEEQEARDRRRAEERMGARHRESRWAKEAKKIGRAGWDEDARADMNDMARRNEELRMRVEGQKVPRSDQSASDSSDSDSDSQDDGGFKLREELDRVNAEEVEHGSKLASMKFMQRAEAARKQRNNEAIAELQRDLDGESSQSDSETEGPVGRRSFGPTQAESVAVKATLNAERNDLEEGSASDVDEEVAQDRIEALQVHETTTTPRATIINSKARGTIQRPSNTEIKAFEQQDLETKAPQIEKAKDSIRPADVIRKNRPAPDTSKWRAVPYSADDTNENQGEGEESTDGRLTLADNRSSQQAMINEMFGGDEVTENFAEEKRQAEDEEEEQIIDNSMPGWGSWAGSGVSKREQKATVRHNKARQTKSEGVKRSDRQDAKLERAIISEKRIKKNAKYLAASLPHPFETRAQYERSLRIPVGPEWTTKESFQKATKPRVLIKQGIIKPLSRPLI